MVISIVNVFAIIDAVIVRAVVLLNIAAVGAIFIIVADVVDVISSSRTTEYPDHAHLHHRLAQTILGIEDAIIDAVIGRAAVPHHEFCQTSCGWEGVMFARALEMTTSRQSGVAIPINDKQCKAMPTNAKRC